MAELTEEQQAIYELHKRQTKVYCVIKDRRIACKRAVDALQALANAYQDSPANIPLPIDYIGEAMAILKERHLELSVAEEKQAAALDVTFNKMVYKGIV